MDQRERIQLHQHCVVPYRHTERGIEFCLVSKVSENRWEFPNAEIDGEQANPELSLSTAVAGAGLRGQFEVDDPLDGFVAARGNESRSVTAYLMRVTLVDDDWPTRATQRRLWCLPEEARARLRRKPFRRFIDSALRLVGATLSATNGVCRPPSSALPRKPR